MSVWILDACFKELFFLSAPESRAESNVRRGVAPIVAVPRLGNSGLDVNWSSEGYWDRDGKDGDKRCGDLHVERLEV